jgi:hypothetical protein
MRYTKVVPVIAYLLLLTGCATSTQTYAPDGGQAHSINCSGAALTWGMCYEKAGSICKERGYDVVGGGSDANGIVTANNGSAVGVRGSTRSMVIKCK